jgi:hypothetical protein
VLAWLTRASLEQHERKGQKQMNSCASKIIREPNELPDLAIWPQARCCHHSPARVRKHHRNIFDSQARCCGHQSPARVFRDHRQQKVEAIVAPEAILTVNKIWNAEYSICGLKRWCHRRARVVSARSVCTCVCKWRTE